MRSFPVLIILFLVFAAGASAEPQQSEVPYVMEEVTVTATKREQRLKDIASSLSVSTDSDLENIHAVTLKDATGLFPNVYMKSTSSGNEIVIRGFSTWDTALQSPAGLYVDGVPYPLSFTQNIYLHDIDRIEVLRGPQGTLYGKNSESGVVTLVRRLPDNTPRGSIFTEAGNYNLFRVGASASGPVVEDKVYMSGSFLRHQTDGFVKNIHKDTKRAAKHEVDSGRVLLRVTPTDELDLRLSVDAVHSDDGRGTMRFATGPDKSGRLRVRSDAPDSASSTLTVPSLTAEFTGDSVKLTSITSYMDYGYKMKSDIDRTPRFIGISDLKLHQTSLSQELRMASAGEERLSWVAGVYLGTLTTHADMDRLRRMAAATTYLHSKYTEDTGALFTQATYAFFEDVRFTAGLRAESTRLHGTQRHTTGRGLSRQYGKTLQHTELLPMAAVSWDMNDAVTSYISWSQGYLPGGFNIFSASNKDNFYYKPEYSTNYELGLKTNWMDNKLFANASVFYSTIDDKQVREEDPSGGVGTWKFTNSAKAHSTGAELELKAIPFKGVEIRGGIGYARSEIDSWSVSTRQGEKRSYKGKRLPWAPDTTYTLGAGYTHDSGFFARADFFGSGKQYFDAENTLSDAGYKTLNIQAGYINENWDVSVWGKNVFDDRYAVKKLKTNGQTLVEDGEPMTFGASLAWRF